MGKSHPPQSDRDRPAEPDDELSRDAPRKGSRPAKAGSSQPDDATGASKERGKSSTGDGGSKSRDGAKSSSGPIDWPGHALLAHKSAREVLSRLIDGDPLEVGPRCIARIEHHARFIDVRRLHLRAVARIAHAAPRYRGEPALDPWIDARIDASMDDLMSEDSEEERSDIPPSDPWDPRYAFLAEAMGIEPTLARRACIAFNDLPTDVRRTYFAVVVAKKTIHRYVAEGNGPPEKVKTQLQRVLDTIRAAIEPRPGDEKGGSEHDGR
jgi:hypothetical protein